MGTSSRPSIASDDVLLVPCRQTTTEERVSTGKEKQKETTEEKGDEAGREVLVVVGTALVVGRRGDGQARDEAGGSGALHYGGWLTGETRKRVEAWLGPRA